MLVKAAFVMLVGHTRMEDTMCVWVFYVNACAFMQLVSENKKDIENLGREHSS